MKPTVLIIGGGPAGAACGIETSRRGFNTLLFEKGAKHREKVCGDGLLFDAQRALKHLGLHDKVKRKSSIAPEAIFTFRNKKTITIYGPFLTLQRNILDQILRDEVEKKGGDVKYNCNITQINIKKDFVEISDSLGKKHKGDIVVLATGANIALAQKLGFKLDPPKLIAIRGYIKNNTNLKKYHFWLNKDPSTGYSWAFPCPNNMVNVGIGNFSNKKNKSTLKLHTALKTLVHENFNNTQFITPPKAWVLKTGLNIENSFADRVLLVGENINTTYNLLGEGVGKSLESGIFAAKTISKSKSPYDKFQLAKYKEYLQEMNKFHKGYTRIHELVSKRFPRTLLTILLLHSKKARRIMNLMAREEIAPNEKTSIKKILKILSFKPI